MDVLPETRTGMSSSNPGKLLDALFTETTQRYLERGQDAARNLMDLNAAFLEFLNQRASSNRETLVRMMRCKDLPDLMSVESSWVRLAFDDYAREAGRLVDYNARTHRLSDARRARNRIGAGRHAVAGQAPAGGAACCLRARPARWGVSGGCRIKVERSCKMQPTRD